MTKISNLYALTNQIYVNSSGTAIGIGTTTPSSKLEVAGSVMAHGALTLGSGYAINFYDKGTTAYTWIEGSSYNQSYSFLAFTTGGSEKVRIDSSGNFGIGVAIPSYKLDVNGTARISGALSGTSALFSSSVTATNAIFNGTAAPIRTESTTNNEMQIVRSTTSYGAGFGFYTGSTHNWLLGTAWGETSSNFILYNAATGTQSFKVNYSTNAATFSSSVTVGSGLLSIQGAQQNNLWLNQNAGGTTTGFLLGRSYTSTNSQDFFIYDVAAAAPRFVISSSGNIGIGTTAPETINADFKTLQIDGTSGAMLRTGTSAYGGYVATIPTADVMVISNVRNPINGTFSNTGKAGSVINLWGESNNGYLTFSTSPTNNTGPTERMRITSGGNVGINGTPYSYAKLNVFDTGALITGGTATAGTNMKGVFIENTLNGDESIGVWFRTGSNHLSGISGQRDDNTQGWGTDLRFYTHERNTADLSSTRERMRITPSGNIDTKGNSIYAYSGSFSMGASYQTIFTSVSDAVYLISVNTNPSSGDGTFGLLIAFNEGDKSCGTIYGNNILIQFSGNDVQIRSSNGSTYSVSWSATRLK